MTPKRARLVAIVLGAILFLTGIGHFRYPLHISLTGLLLIAGGAAICLNRWWGYYLAYTATLLGLWPLFSEPQNAIAYFPFSALFAAIDKFLLFPRPVTVLAGNLMFIGALVWTQLVLHPTGELSEPLSPLVCRRVTVICLALSSIVFVLPLAWFVYALFVDPPTGGRNPGGWNPGAYPFMVALIVWPFVLAGIVGSLVCWLLLRRMRRADEAASNPRP